MIPIHRNKYRKSRSYAKILIVIGDLLFLPYIFSDVSIMNIYACKIKMKTNAQPFRDVFLPVR